MSKIWFKDYTLEEINSIFQKFMTGYLNIQATEVRDDMLIASMPISDKVKQPFGILHGGASVVLAESVGSIASNLIIDPQRLVGVGMEVNANHLKSVAAGTLYAYCSPLHIGKKSHVWDIKIKNEKDVLICVSRLTVAIVDKPS
ncbi:hotdog fold thioesterase [Sphingobacterium sp. DN00404]|uniref:Hotdog fold thioesterase n=1 Tax=Sphingobacterium micropteri TaxID=2763501 RepID=A0ABR7YL19_9SPHI|nr:hotdog fold thioesterase [Sphingobacterium micropteri]MBD1432017.1 hotdog fold thioesterase [Sphingobacterium micropteri]